MKFSVILPFAAIGAAFVLPPEQVLGELEIEDHHQSTGVYDETVAIKDDLIRKFDSFLRDAKDRAKSAWEDVSEASQNLMDDAFSRADHVATTFGGEIEESADGLQAWLEGHDDLFLSQDDRPHGPEHGPPPPPPPPPHHGPPPPPHHGGPPPPPPHHGGPPPPPHHGGPPPPPHHGPPPPPHHGGPPPPPHHDDPHHKPPHHGDPHHGHGKPNLTVYQLIAGSKYTTKLAKLISEYDDLVEALNSTSANYTVFAPTDKAFEKIPSHHPKPTKEQLKAVLSYHVVPDYYPAGRVLASHTAPTLLKGKHLASNKEPQRIAFKLGLRGLTVNFYSRVVAINIFGTNGVIHGVDSLLIPPPSVITLIDLLPGEFSTLELGLGKTGLLDKLNTTDHAGGTFFAPSNWAFQKLGPRINAFLFSKYGEKYLKALLEYHVVPDHTLYSDAYYHAKDGDDDDKKKKKSQSHSSADDTMMDIPKGYFHVDLPTLLASRSLSIDIARYGGFISMKINGFSSVAVQDGVAEDGVLHLVSSVLIPPKTVGGKMVMYEGGELTEEDLKERLEPFLVDGEQEKKSDL